MSAEYDGYKRSSLDDFSMDELIKEVERRRDIIDKRAEVDKAIEDITQNIRSAEVISEVDNFVKKTYTIEVRYEWR